MSAQTEAHRAARRLARKGGGTSPAVPKTDDELRARAAEINIALNLALTEWAESFADACRARGIPGDAFAQAWGRPKRSGGRLKGGYVVVAQGWQIAPDLGVLTNGATVVINAWSSRWYGPGPADYFTARLARDTAKYFGHRDVGVRSGDGRILFAEQSTADEPQSKRAAGRVRPTPFRDESAVVEDGRVRVHQRWSTEERPRNESEIAFWMRTGEEHFANVFAEVIAPFTS